MLLRMLKKMWNGSPETLGAAVAARPAGVSRRDFLRAAGVTTTTVALGGMGGSLWLPEKKAIATGAIGMMGVAGPAGAAPATFAGLAIPPAVAQWFSASQGVMPSDVAAVVNNADVTQLFGIPGIPPLDPIQAALRAIMRDIVDYQQRARMLEQELQEIGAHGHRSGFVAIGHLPGHEGPVVEPIGDPVQQSAGEPTLG